MYWPILKLGFNVSSSIRCLEDFSGLVYTNSNEQEQVIFLGNLNSDIEMWRNDYEYLSDGRFWINGRNFELKNFSGEGVLIWENGKGMYIPYANCTISKAEKLIKEFIEYTNDRDYIFNAKDEKSIERYGEYYSPLRKEDWNNLKKTKYKNFRIDYAI